MSYDPQTFSELRQSALDEYRNQVNGADVSEDGELFARASAWAASLAMLSQSLKYVERQVFPQTADSDNLERHAGLYDLTRKTPTAATDGSVELTGTNSTVVSSGLTLTHADGTEYVTTSGGTIAGGVLSVDIDAVTTGAIGNKVVGDELTVQSPPVGVDAEATIDGDVTGGTDTETDADLAQRVLLRMQAGNAGGTHIDYEQWALAVNGVVYAHCLPLRRGAGTVSVAVFSEGAGGWRSPANSTVRTAVLNELNDQRPVTADVDVPAVTEVPVDVTVSALVVEPGFAEDEVIDAVEDAIEAFIYGLETGDTCFLSQLGRAIASVAGVRDFSIDAPASNVVPTVDASNVEILYPRALGVSA